MMNAHVLPEMAKRHRSEERFWIEFCPPVPQVVFEAVLLWLPELKNHCRLNINVKNVKEQKTTLKQIGKIISDIHRTKTNITQSTDQPKIKEINKLHNFKGNMLINMRKNFKK